MDNNITDNMPDLGDIISKLTSDPSMMDQISKLASSFKSNTSAPEPEEDDVAETMARRPSPHRQSPLRPPHSNNKHHKNPHFNVDTHTQLFKALKPYLNAERRETLEYIMQLFNIIKLLEMSGLNLGHLLPAFNTSSAAVSTNDTSEE